MRSFFSFSIIFAAITALALTISAQVKPSAVSGDVVSVDGQTITLKTKDGDLKVTLSASTEYKRVPPEDPVLKAAVASSLSEIETGDKLLVTGIFGDDRSTLPARAVYLMSKSAIAEKQRKETQEWATRGISGKVVSVDPAVSKITVSVRGLMNSTNIVVSPKADGLIKRYAPNSVKYSEAVEGSISDIKTGDMIRALGDKSTDGASMDAEVIVTGAFQTVAGTVKSIDTEKNEIVVTTQSGPKAEKKDVTIALGPGSAMKKFPEDMAARFAQFGGGGVRPAGSGQGTPGAPGQGGQGQAAPGTTEGRPGPGGMGGGARGGIDDMFERLPAIQLSDLKVGDMIAVSSSKNADTDHITAIKLLAGVEPFLRLAQSGEGRRGRGGSVDGSFTIPGLDGFDFP